MSVRYIAIVLVISLNLLLQSVSISQTNRGKFMRTLYAFIIMESAI